MQWGLAHTHCVTVPLSVMVFVSSYTALPWCASSGSETIEIARTRIRAVRNLPFKRHLLHSRNNAWIFGLGSDDISPNLTRCYHRWPTPVPLSLVSSAFVSPDIAPRASRQFCGLECKIEGKRRINSMGRHGRSSRFD